MAKRKLEKEPRTERMLRVLDYLKYHSDKEHPVTQQEMRKDPSISAYVGHKETFNRMIKDMARALNCDEAGRINSESEWKICFDDFKALYGDNACNDDGCENSSDTMHIKGLYYNRAFTYDEVNSLIEGVLSNRTIDSKSAQKLIEKIEDNLTTKFYKRGPKHICKVMEPELADKSLLQSNLMTIQKAIDENVQISFRFNGYTHLKKLEPVRARKDVVSPYYIVASNGRYYLLACKEMIIEDETIRNMSIWRIDLMTDIEIPGVNNELKIKGKPSIPKRKVDNLPIEWSEDFQLKHLNMSFDKPELITLRIKSEKLADDPTKRIRPDYTFMHDWFGNSFKYIETEKEVPYNDIVRVECSPYAMINWALQYSDKVEVLEPISIRAAVIEKIKNLQTKYQVNE